MKRVETVQPVSRRAGGGNSGPQRSSSLHAVAKRTCGRATERDRSCVERECGGAIEPRYLYNRGSSPTRVGRTPSLCSGTKAMGRSRMRTYAAKHRRGLRTTHALTGIVRELRESHAGLPPERSGVTMGNAPDQNPLAWPPIRRRSRANKPNMEGTAWTSGSELRGVVVWQS